MPWHCVRRLGRDARPSRHAIPIGYAGVRLSGRAADAGGFAARSLQLEAPAGAVAPDAVDVGQHRGAERLPVLRRGRGAQGVEV